MGDPQDEMWDEEDGFFYDLLRLPNGEARRLQVRSMAGLLPLCAATVFEADATQKFPRLMAPVELFRKRHPEVVSHVALDEDEFLSPHGIRSLSCHHLEHPFTMRAEGQAYDIRYLPAESNTGMFGGNSTWRGPVWMPVSARIVRGLINLYGFQGDDFRVERPTGSGNRVTPFEVAQEISRRLSSLFLRDASGRRPVYGGSAKFREDPHWRDPILFYEYLHGDNGAGLGASQQTGWTGVIARVIDLFGRVTPEALLETSKERLLERLVRE